MIEALLAWSREYPHQVNVRAMMLGAVGRPGAPDDPLLLDLRHYLWLVEGVIRDLNEKNHEALDKLYRQGAARLDRLRNLAASREAHGAARVSAVEAFVRAATT